MNVNLARFLMGFPPPNKKALLLVLDSLGRGGVRGGETKANLAAKSLLLGRFWLKASNHNAAVVKRR